MKSLITKLIAAPEEELNIAELSLRLDRLKKHGVDSISWQEFSYLPDVKFAMAYHENYLALKFYVEEKYLKISHTEPNEPVYKDSCVECFIAFEDEPGYFNFEFNAAGNCLAAYGDNRNDRRFLPPAILSAVETASFIHSAREQAADEVRWQLVVRIPFTIFHGRRLEDVLRTTCRVNLYKCGDDTALPHYVSWSPVKTSSPDFHRPEFFGRMHFA